MGSKKNKNAIGIIFLLNQKPSVMNIFWRTLLLCILGGLIAYAGSAKTFLEWEKYDAVQIGGWGIILGSILWAGWQRTRLKK
jgi:hypothetical protein